MRLEWINKKVMTAAAVLSFSCVAAAAYTAVKDVRIIDTLSIGESDSYGFVDSMLDAEASLYDISFAKTQQAKNI